MKQNSAKTNCALKSENADGQASHQGHIVQFYNNESELAGSVVSFMTAGLNNNEGSLIIATPSHREIFENSLNETGLNVAKLKKQGRLVILDAAETLSKIIVDGLPDPNKFREFIGTILDSMEKLYPNIKAYGEMVGILWDTGNIEGTILLEQYWNELAKEKSFTLLCGYGSHQFPEASHSRYFNQIGKEGYRESHYRVIAELQQREKALHSEISERKRVEEILKKEAAERKRIETELRRNQADLNDFFDNATVGLHWIGPDGTILRANQAELNLLGYSQEEYVGHNITEFHTDTDVINELLKRLTNQENIQSFPARLKCKNNMTKHVLIDSNVYWENGKFIHTRCFTRDVTEIKLATQSVAHLMALSRIDLDNLKEEREIRERFVAALTHDLRNPLSVAKMGIQHLINKGFTDSSVSLLKRIVESIERADHMIHNLLDANRISAGQEVPIRIGTCELHSLIVAAIEELSVVHGDRFILNGDQNIVGQWSRTALQRIIDNLANNAVKYGSKNTPITITLKQIDKWVRLTVQNEGVGITPTAQAGIFEPYRRETSAENGRQQGWGLGLTIVRGLIKAHGGTISVQSEIGKGATFTIELPLDAGPFRSPIKINSGR
ncbi:MAG: ATP-binding protein [Pseudomonadota bacterium]|nr:ATP-binding protein [Pseudomonadota bacterium]